VGIWSITHQVTPSKKEHEGNDTFSGLPKRIAENGSNHQKEDEESGVSRTPGRGRC